MFCSLKAAAHVLLHTKASAVCSALSRLRCNRNDTTYLMQPNCYAHGL